MGITTFTAKVLSKQSLTDSVILLSVTRPLDFEFKAGQFVSFVLFGKDGERKLRSFSILSPPSQKKTLDFCIKIIDGGFASEVFKEMLVGDEFEVKGPFGHFVFDEESETSEHWFIGAGTGVAPLYCMVKEYLPRLSDAKFTLLCGYREQKDLLFHEEFKHMELDHIHFEYVPTLSQEDWKGAQGRVQVHLGDDLEDKTFYICGLKELVLETKELLVSRGVDPARIKSERYN